MAEQAEHRRLRTEHPEAEDLVERGLAAFRSAHPLPRPTIAQVADHVDHVREVAGIGRRGGEGGEIGRRGVTSRAPAT